MTIGDGRPLSRRLLDSFWVLLAKTNVHWLWQTMYYLPFLAWGIYGTFFAYPISIIVDQIGQQAYNFWVWAVTPGTLGAMAGLALRHGGAPSDTITGPLLRLDYLGLRMQFGGHTFMGIILIIYEVTGIRGAYWGQPVISLFLIFAYSLGVPLLAAQCARKMWLGRRGQ